MESVEFHVLIEDIMVPMRDGVRLCGDLYLPAIEGKVPAHHRWPCVLVRTPYNKSVSNPDFRHPGHYWTQNGYSCFIQDCRGRFKSEGEFYKYTGEAYDGYDTVEWIAIQSWCNGNVVTDGPSYLCHVQTSMAILRPPHLRAMFCNKGGFFNAHTSGVRQGGCYEARQWIWGIKHAPRKTIASKAALESIEKNLGAWLQRYPFKKGDSPLTISSEYENYIFDQVEKADYGDYWKQIGLNTEEYLDEFADIPALFLSGWYDIYCRSTIDFFVNLVERKKGPILLIMGPWQHVGAEAHIAGEVDFGVQALISGNLAPTVFSLSRRWFDRFVDPVMIHDIETEAQQDGEGEVEEQDHVMVDHLTIPSPGIKDASLSPHGKLNAAIAAVEKLEEKDKIRNVPRGPYTSFSRMSLEVPAAGPSLYISPSVIPRQTREPVEPLPPRVRYFRMGGGDGHCTQQGMMFHGGVWMAAETWPPSGNEGVNFFLQKRSLVPALYNQQLHQHKHTKKGVTPPSDLHHNSAYVSYFAYDPSNPCPTIGGNLFGHGNVLLAGAYDQTERPDMFLCRPPFLPLSSRRDVVVFRTPPLTQRLDVTGQPYVILYISSSCVDTDFSAKLIDEYPPSADYPHGFALAVTHGIQRCRYRNSREHAELMEPGKVYEIRIDLYPTSNLFNVGHHLRLDISSSNFPHFDLNMNTGDDAESQRMMIAENSIWHHSAFPSRIVLPIQKITQATTHHANDGGKH